MNRDYIMHTPTPLPLICRLLGHRWRFNPTDSYPYPSRGLECTRCAGKVIFLEGEDDSPGSFEVEWVLEPLNNGNP